MTWLRRIVCAIRGHDDKAINVDLAHFDIRCNRCLTYFMFDANGNPRRSIEYPPTLIGKGATK